MSPQISLCIPSWFHLSREPRPTACRTNTRLRPCSLPHLCSVSLLGVLSQASPGEWLCLESQCHRDDSLSVRPGFKAPLVLILFSLAPDLSPALEKNPRSKQLLASSLHPSSFASHQVMALLVLCPDGITYMALVLSELEA